MNSTFHIGVCAYIDMQDLSEKYTEDNGKVMEPRKQKWRAGFLLSQLESLM